MPVVQIAGFSNSDTDTQTNTQKPSKSPLTTSFVIDNLTPITVTSYSDDGKTIGSESPTTREEALELANILSQCAEQNPDRVGLIFRENTKQNIVNLLIDAIDLKWPPIDSVTDAQRRLKNTGNDLHFVITTIPPDLALNTANNILTQRVTDNGPVVQYVHSAINP